MGGARRPSLVGPALFSAASACGLATMLVLAMAPVTSALPIYANYIPNGACVTVAASIEEVSRWNGGGGRDDEGASFYTPACGDCERTCSTDARLLLTASSVESCPLSTVKLNYCCTLIVGLMFLDCIIMRRKICSVPHQPCHWRERHRLRFEWLLSGCAVISLCIF